VLPPTGFDVAFLRRFHDVHPPTSTVQFSMMSTRRRPGGAAVQVVEGGVWPSSAGLRPSSAASALSTRQPPPFSFPRCPCQEITGESTSIDASVLVLRTNAAFLTLYCFICKWKLYGLMDHGAGAMQVHDGLIPWTLG
jgi:hypothetical protein